MSEPQDSLRPLFRQAGEFGRVHADAAPVAHIAERGRRAHRRRIATLAAGACLVIACGSAGAVSLLPDRPVPVAPATSPSPSLPPPEPTGPPPVTDVPTTGAPATGAPATGAPATVDSTTQSPPSGDGTFPTGP